MTGKRELNHLEQDLRVGIALGAGLSLERAADLLDVAKNTVLGHSKCPHTLEVKAIASAAMTKQVERRVDESKEAWQREMRKYRGKHLDLADKLITKAEDEGADADLIAKTLKVTGDLLDRDPDTSRSQKVEHEHSGEIAERHILEIDATALAALQLAVKEVKQLTEGSTPPVIDVEPIE